MCCKLNSSAAAAAAARATNKRGKQIAERNKLKQ